MITAAPFPEMLIMCFAGARFGLRLTIAMTYFGGGGLRFPDSIFALFVSFQGKVSHATIGLERERWVIYSRCGVSSFDK